jgi:hypothetical protein
MKTTSELRRRSLRADPAGAGEVAARAMDKSRGLVLGDL